MSIVRSSRCGGSGTGTLEQYALGGAEALGLFGRRKICEMAADYFCEFIREFAGGNSLFARLLSLFGHITSPRGAFPTL
jgi:hypothetical protein